MVNGSERAGFADWWHRHGTTTLLMLAFFLLALFVRSYFNIDASTGDRNFRWSGTDGYYHMRVVESILDTGQHLGYDPMINYPIGATNPRPPIFNWSIAIFAVLLAPFFGGDKLLAANYVAAWSPAVWGALTLIPLYLLGRTLFGRKTGLWASFFLAVMPAHIQRSALGGLDHDATILFFLVLGAYFIAKALKVEHDARWIDDYRKPSSIARGFAAFWRENRLSLAWMALAGVSFAAIALTWQGFPYVLAVFAAYFVVQLLVDNLRHRDSFGTFNLMLVLAAVTILLAWPYYEGVGRVHAHIYPALYILAGMVAFSLVLVPTRDIPPLLVLPGVVVLAGLGYLVARFLVPEIGAVLFTGLGYFVQTKLYSTIAEAQRTELGFLGFAGAVVPFFFALVGFFFLAVRWWKGQRRDHLLMLMFTAVNVFMAFAASRFVFNASINFALLGGWVAMRIVKRTRFREVRDTWAGVRGGNSFWKSMRMAVRPRHAVMAGFLGVLVVLPNLWFAADAGMSQEWRNQQVNDLSDDRAHLLGWNVSRFARNTITDFTGAFGQDMLAGSWIDALAYLERQDQDVAPGDRPAFIAWWDYGFYAVQEGKHPTVADPFQFGYQLSGRFLAAQSEEEAAHWAAIRLLEGDLLHRGLAVDFTADVRAVLEDANVTGSDYQALRAALTRIPERDYDQAYLILSDKLSGQAVYDFYGQVSGATGWSIRYFVVDNRMMPFDDPNTLGVDSSSIFYAPVFLANKNPDDFIQTTYVGANGQEYFLRQYESGPDNVSRQIGARIEDANGRRFTFVGPGELTREVNGQPDYAAQNTIQISREMLSYKAPFYETMFYRAYVGTQPQAGQDLPPFQSWAPGSGLLHWRAVHINNAVRVLKYYEGAEVTGTVTTAAGEPMPAVTVQVFDNFGIVHDQARTNARGEYRVLAPFSTEGEEGGGPNALQVVDGTTVLGGQNFTVSDDQAMGLAPSNLSFDFSIETADFEGFVFEDVNGDGQYNASVDEPLPNVSIHLSDGEATTDADGEVRLEGLAPGTKDLSATLDGYESATQRVSLVPGETATANVSMRPRPVEVQGLARHEGEAKQGITLSFTPGGEFQTPQTSVTNVTGAFSVRLPPGTWTVSGNGTAFENDTTVRYEVVEQEFELALGQETFALSVELRRVEE